MNDMPMRELAVELVVLLDQLCSNIDGRSVFKNQLLRSGSSIGANIHEARYAQSSADFISKLEIALKECYETEYWLEIMKDADIITAHRYNELISECGYNVDNIYNSIISAK